MATRRRTRSPIETEGDAVIREKSWPSALKPPPPPVVRQHFRPMDKPFEVARGQAPIFIDQTYGTFDEGEHAWASNQEGFAEAFCCNFRKQYSPGADSLKKIGEKLSGFDPVGV